MDFVKAKLNIFFLFSLMKESEKLQCTMKEYFICRTNKAKYNGVSFISLRNFFGIMYYYIKETGFYRNMLLCDVRNYFRRLSSTNGVDC